MTQPNEYVLKEKGRTIGLHRYKDGLLMFELHRSGDWFSLWPPTPEQVKYFERYGTPAGAGIQHPELVRRSA